VTPGSKARRSDQALILLGIGIGTATPDSKARRSGLVLEILDEALVLEILDEVQVLEILDESRKIPSAPRVRTRTRRLEARFQAIRRSEVRGLRDIPTRLEGTVARPLVLVQARRVRSRSVPVGRTPRTVEPGCPAASTGSTATFSQASILGLIRTPMPSNSSN
jgi:hypothetical protein